MQTRAQVPGRILVIDDEAVVKELLARVLGKAGHEVVAVSNGEEALREIVKARFDLLIVDKNLPGMNGLDVMRLVRGHEPHLRAILITAYPTRESEVEAKELGIHAYVVKPFGIVAMIATVDEAIRAGRAGQ
ncbi:MAG TPA: response regulator [Anaeromyxobacteraceae bacterium]|nr:response regulator [Anaeromyxobacteraceae bacterium]